MEQFKHLWFVQLYTLCGVAISAGLFVVIAVQSLGASPSEVVFVSASSALVAAFGCIPLTLVGQKYSGRTILVFSSGVRSGVSGALLIINALGALNLFTLALGFAAVAALSIFSASVAGVEIRRTLPEDQWLHANKSFGFLGWITVAVLTPLGGVTVSCFGVNACLALNAICHTLAVSSAFRLSPHTEKHRFESDSYCSRALAGWIVIYQHKELRSYFHNALVFGGSLAISAPLIALMVLRDLELSPAHLSVVLSLPTLFALLGNQISASIASRFGELRAAYWSGFSRALWLIVIPLAPDGHLGFYVLLAAECMFMLCVGVFNPIFATRRLKLVPKEKLRSVGSAWPISFHLIRPVFLVAGAIVLSQLSVRFALLAAGLFMLSSAVLLPRPVLQGSAAALSQPSRTDPSRI